MKPEAIINETFLPTKEDVGLNAEQLARKLRYMEYEIRELKRRVEYLENKDWTSDAIGVIAKKLKDEY